MIKSKVGRWTVLAVALGCFAACGKRNDAAPAPVLSTPSADEKVVAQAEVKASSGPIEISFRLHKTEIKAGDYPWHQIRLRNVGEKTLVVSAPIFREPRKLARASDSRYGVYLEALGPDGSKLKVEYPLPADSDSYSSDEVSGMLEVEGPEEKAMLEAWKKQGLSQMDIDRKLFDFNAQKRVSAESGRRLPAIKITPGQAVETKSTFAYSAKDKSNGKSIPKPRGEFGQIDFFDFDKPGRYKLRAVYDYSPPDIKRARSSDDLLVRTPWIVVTVLP